jgi:hypothetical protein
MTKWEECGIKQQGICTHLGIASWCLTNCQNIAMTVMDLAHNYSWILDPGPASSWLLLEYRVLKQPKMTHCIFLHFFDVEHPRWRMYTRYIYISFSERKSVTTNIFSLFYVKITERPGFSLYSHHQALWKHEWRNFTSHEGKGLLLLQSEMMLHKIKCLLCK